MVPCRELYFSYKKTRLGSTVVSYLLTPLTSNNYFHFKGQILIQLKTPPVFRGTRDLAIGQCGN